jgi:hypothetical protein
MPGSTPIFGFPYPLGSDPVSDGDGVIRALAEDVENTIRPVAFRTVNPVVSLSVTGTGQDAAQMGDALVFTPTVGRRYLVDFFCPRVSGGQSTFTVGSTISAATWTFTLRTAIGAFDSATAIAQQQLQVVDTRQSGFVDQLRLSYNWQPSTTTPVSLNVWLSLAVTQGTGGSIAASMFGSNLYGQATMSVYDIGPAI